jgi:hypothetical protein
MRKLALFGLAGALAVIAFAETIKYSALESMEHNFESKLLAKPGKQPFEIISNATAYHVPGSGVMLSARVNLVYVTPAGPFLQPTPAELDALKSRLHLNKLEKVPVLEQDMREVLAETAVLPAFDAVPPNEQFAMGVSLFYFPKEDTAGLPHLITMNAEKSQLLKAVREKADLATVIHEEKQ